MLGFSRAIHNAAIHGNAQRFYASVAFSPLLHLCREMALYLFGKLLKEGACSTSAARAGSDLRQKVAQSERLQDLLRYQNLFGPISSGPRSEAHTDRITD